jgi:hypothetical protein
VARRLAERGVWYRLLTDPASGTVLDVGKTRYEPPADLANHVMARDVTCRGPGCRQPAHRCHFDHTVRYPDGPTAAHNLGPLCEQDHLAKHRRGWRLAQPAPGTFVWASPAGHTYPIEPEQVGPILADLTREMITGSDVVGSDANARPPPSEGEPRSSPVLPPKPPSSETGPRSSEALSPRPPPEASTDQFPF